MDEMDLYLEDMCKLSRMLDDWNLTPENYYDEFSNMCTKYLDSSRVPYHICKDMISEEYPCEEYYMKMLMDVYGYYNVGEGFLELLQQLNDEGYADTCKAETHKQIKEHINDGYVIAYRGEFATEKRGNRDYRDSVSYSLSYDDAKFFATRFSVLNLTKSVVYTVKVPIDDVLAYIDREDEVVCLPISIGGKMEVIKEDSFL